MAVFEELNRRTERLQDPEVRKPEKIERAAPEKLKKKSGSTSVTINTFNKTRTIVKIATGVIILGAVAYFTYQAVQLFIN